MAINKYFHKVTIKGFVPENCNRRVHWAKEQKNRDLWHSIIAREFKFKPENPIEKSIVRVEMCYPYKTDYDNFVWRCKPIFDGLVKAGIILDDSMDNVIDRKYILVKVPKKFKQISIEVEEL